MNIQDEQVAPAQKTPPSPSSGAAPVTIAASEIPAGANSIPVELRRLGWLCPEDVERVRQAFIECRTVYLDSIQEANRPILVELLSKHANILRDALALLPAPVQHEKAAAAQATSDTTEKTQGTNTENVKADILTPRADCSS